MIENIEQNKKPAMRVKVKNFLTGQLFLNLVTVLLAIGTFWLAWTTKRLVDLEQSPHIDIADVAVQLVDITGTTVKNKSWKIGETLNTGAIYKQAQSINLVVKFANSGKNAGYVELLNYKKILDEFSSSNAEPEVFVGGRLFVPGSDETGWSYVIDIINYFKKCPRLNNACVFDVPYELGIYNVKGREISRNVRHIRCVFAEVKAGGINFDCKPIQQSPNKSL